MFEGKRIEKSEEFLPSDEELIESERKKEAIAELNQRRATEELKAHLHGLNRDGVDTTKALHDVMLELDIKPGKDFEIGLDEKEPKAGETIN